MDARQILKTFNDHFEEFVDDVQRAFPADTDVATCRTVFREIRKANPTLIIKVFKTCVVEPYRDQISIGDMNFFIQKDYQRDLADMGSSTNAILTKIDCLRAPIGEMNGKELGKVIKYIQNLGKLCDLYN
jgi:hypothetical protein